MIKTSFQTKGYLGIALLAYSVNSVSAVHSDSLRVDISHNDNVGLSGWEEDKITDEVFELNLARTWRKTIGLSQSIFYGADLNLREYLDYPCDRISLLARLGYEKKLGIGFDKPRISLLWNGARHHYRQGARDGYTSELSARISRPFGERLDLSAGISKHWEIPDDRPESVPMETYSMYGAYPYSDSYGYALPSDVFNLEFINLDISAEFYANERWSFPASVSYLDGDLISVSRARTSNFAYADAVMRDDAVGPDWYAYRASGKAWSANLGASRLMDDGSILNFQLEHNSAEAAGNMEYDRNVARISWVKNW